MYEMSSWCVWEWQKKANEENMTVMRVIALEILYLAKHKHQFSPLLFSFLMCEIFSCRVWDWQKKTKEVTLTMMHVKSVKYQYFLKHSHQSPLFLFSKCMKCLLGECGSGKRKQEEENMAVMRVKST